MSGKVSVTIYSKPGCHLCEEAKAVMLAAGCRELFTITETNIETDPELLARYRYDIPVIMIDGAEVFRHRIVAKNFRAAIEKALAIQPARPESC
jgi:glutaredoxin